MARAVRATVEVFTNHDQAGAILDETMMYKSLCVQLAGIIGLFELDRSLSEVFVHVPVRDDDTYLRITTTVLLA